MVKAEREQKDAFFALHPQSPIPVEGRSRFEGLAYFPPDPGYRFELPLYEHEGREVITVEDTAGNRREMVRWGEFRFTVGAKECKLQAYRTDLSEERLFIPFRDATSGHETYGAGRYLDLEADEYLTGEEKWVVDLNRAYNPWCAYSQDYACPFVPPENWLEVSIRAGERSYRADEE
jgi:uncharacterized protein (DUF1684 family)